MSYKQKTADIRSELRVLHKLNPETAKGFQALSAGAMADGALDKKQREFVALAIAELAQLVREINLLLSADRRRADHRREAVFTVAHDAALRGLRACGRVTGDGGSGQAGAHQAGSDKGNGFHH